MSKLLCKLGLHKWCPNYTGIGGYEYFCENCNAEKGGADE